MVSEKKSTGTAVNIADATCETCGNQRYNGGCGLAISTSCTQSVTLDGKPNAVPTRWEPKRKSDDLSKWTIEQVMEECRNHGGPDDDSYDCHGCTFLKKITESYSVCRLFGLPEKWDFNKMTVFTDQEIEDAKAVIRVCDNVKYVKRSEAGKIIYIPVIGGSVNGDSALFPTILNGQMFDLRAIVRNGKEGVQCWNE